jgi:hypothetical protein
MSQLQGYGFVSDSDESLKTKSGARFGGNFGVATLAKFAYSPNVAKEGQEAREAIEIEIKVGDRSYKEWINPVNRVVDKNNAEITDKTSSEYIAGYNTLVVQQNATVTHYLKAVGVTEEAMKAAFINPVTSFADYSTRICALLPMGYNSKPLDLFLEYQWNFGKKQDGTMNDKTYPTLPKNMKGGYFIIPAQPGVWSEKRAEDGSLSYENSNGQKHPFERDANFMSGNKGTQQVLGQASAASPMGSAVAGSASGTW